MHGPRDPEDSARLERDLASLARICREQEAEIRLMRARLDRLRQSRWRRLGLRLGLVRMQDWESREQIPRH